MRPPSPKGGNNTAGASTDVGTMSIRNLDVSDDLLWEIVISTRAERDLKHLPSREQLRLREAINDLRAGPDHGDVRKLEGRQAEWRLRVGDYRIIFGRDDANRVIVIFQVVPRRDAY